MPEERDLLDIGRDTPCARGPGGKEYDVAWAEPTFFALPIGNEGLAGDDDKSLVLVVMPVEAPGRALPNHLVRVRSMPLARSLARRFCLTFKIPTPGDRAGPGSGAGPGLDPDELEHH